MSYLVKEDSIPDRPARSQSLYRLSYLVKEDSIPDRPAPSQSLNRLSYPVKDSLHLRFYRQEKSSVMPGVM